MRISVFILPVVAIVAYHKNVAALGIGDLAGKAKGELKKYFTCVTCSIKKNQI
jgi:hypothetical protein